MIKTRQEIINSFSDGPIGHIKAEDLRNFVDSSIMYEDSTPTPSQINVKDFGAIGDGIHDDTEAIQSAIDHAIENYTEGKVFIPAGAYRITDTIYLGRGSGVHNFSSVFVEGEGYRYRNINSNLTSGMCGTAIIADFSDRPAINFQGARGSYLKGVAILGKLWDWLNTQNFFSNSPLSDGTNENNWIDPNLNTNQDSQYAPYAGITIDAYSGSQPSPYYPGAYDKNSSSDVLIEDVWIGGFNTAIVNQPCNYDGNGDFTALRRVYMEFCKYGVSIGNSQSRNVSLNECKMTNMFCCLTNNTHGKQIGTFGGSITNLYTNNIINLMDMLLSYVQPLTLSNLHSENLYRIGDLRQNASGLHSVIFDGCNFDFSYHNDIHGVPNNIIGEGQQISNIEFNGCNLTNFPSVLVMAAYGVKFNGTTIQCNTRGYDGALSETNLYLGYANNALCGGVVLPCFGMNWINIPATATRCEHRIKFKPINLNTGHVVDNPSSIVTGPNYRFTSRDYCIPIYVKTVGTSADNCADFSVVPHRIFTVAKNRTGQTDCSLSGKTLTFTYTTSTVGSYGPNVGDVLMDNETNMVFFIRSVTSVGSYNYTAIAEAQNNYKSDGLGGYTQIKTFNTTGFFWFCNSRLYTPTYPILGDISTSNSTILNCKTDTDYSMFLTTDIIPNDYVFVDAFKDLYYQYGKILNINGTTITINSNANYTQTRKRIAFFIRQSPINQ